MPLTSAERQEACASASDTRLGNRHREKIGSPPRTPSGRKQQKARDVEIMGLHSPCCWREVGVSPLTSHER